MKYYYTIETSEGIILGDAANKKDAISKGRETALDYRESVHIGKIEKENHEFVDYVAIIEFPVWLRDWEREKLNIRDTKVVSLTD